MSRVASLAGRALATGLFAVALVVAQRAAPDAVRPFVAEPASPSATRPPRGEGAGDLGVVLRLADAIDRATFEVEPDRERALRVLERHWRRLESPWVAAPGAHAGAVQVVGLATTAERVQGAIDVGGGRSWRPDVRTWNMAEGSFAEREALWAPAPTTMRVPVDVPKGARIEAYAAVVGGAPTGVVFELAAVEAGGRREVVASTSVQAFEAPRWRPIGASLEAFAGRRIELELATRPTSAVADAPAALWGSARLLAPAASELAYDVVWIVVDALRPDAIASLHDPERDARVGAAREPALDAWLPRMPEVAPNLDALAARGVAFTRAYSGATWTRPGTVAMLAGARSTELGLDATRWVLPAGEVGRFYAGAPPLLPLAMRARGALVEAIVDNYFLAGYARIGLDLGFEGLVDHRYDLDDTDRIVADAERFLEANAQRRFFLFLNFDSPHAPYLPPEADRRAIAGAKGAPSDPAVRDYLAEIHKDDRAIGRVTAALDRLGLRERTLVVVTADHGETLSALHDDLVPGLDERPVPQRFHHATSMWEETARVPIVLSLPGRLPEGRRVDAPVSTIDLAPTVAELEGFAPDRRVTGRSLVPLARGDERGDPARPIVVDGRAARSLQVGALRYVERDPAARELRRVGRVANQREELWDLDVDPGERRECSSERPDDVRAMRERLGELLGRASAPDALGSEALAGASTRAVAHEEPARIALRFAGAGASRRVTGALRVPRVEAGARRAELRVAVVGAADDAARTTEDGVDLALATSPDHVVGVDVAVSPPGTRVEWDLFVDDAPWPRERVYAGALGLAAPSYVHGLAGPKDAIDVDATTLPRIDPRRELGLFVVRRGAALDVDLSKRGSPDADREIDLVMRQWGYAHDVARAPR